MIIYVVIFVSALSLGFFIFSSNIKIVDRDRYLASHSAYAFWILRSSPIVFKDYNNHSIPFVLDRANLIRCKKNNCIGFEDYRHLALIFHIPDFDKKILLGREDREFIDNGYHYTYPVLYYENGGYVSGYVEVIIGAS